MSDETRATTPETRALTARVRDGIAPADQPQALRDLARTADGEPRVDAGMLRREAEIVEIRQCIERADRHGPTNRFGDDRTLLTALDAERAENDRLRARVAELEAENAALKRSAAMACEEPCGSCAGCLYADDVHAREDAQGGS